MKRLGAALVEVSNRWPIMTLLFLVAAGGLAFRWVHSSMGGKASILACYAGAAVLCLWAHVVTRANKRKEDTPKPKTLGRQQ